MSEGKQIAWDGTGLPPVGTVCEYLGAHRYDEWSVVRIFAEWGDKVFVDFGDGWRDERDESRFRPMRTPEQIASEEREKAIHAMLDEFPGLDAQTAALIYDACYRKEKVEA